MRKEFANALAIGALLAMTAMARADDAGVLIEQAAIGRQDVIMDVVANALIGRRWKVESRDAAAVVASLGASRIRIYLSGVDLLYQETGSVSVRVGPPSIGATVRRSATNSRWMNNIRKDVRAELGRLEMARSAVSRTPAPVQSPRTAAERLSELEALRASGAVTEAEYTQKRAEILKSL